MLASTVDLHMHSTASDGRLSPATVVQRAAQAGVELMSLTDHDTLDGVVEARKAAADAGIRCLPGIELSARWPEALSILSAWEWMSITFVCRTASLPSSGPG